MSLEENRKRAARFKILHHHVHDAVIAVHAGLIGIVLVQFADEFEPSVPRSGIPEASEIEDGDAIPKGAPSLKNLEFLLKGAHLLDAAECLSWPLRRTKPKVHEVEQSRNEDIVLFHDPAHHTLHCPNAKIFRGGKSHQPVG